MGRIIGFIQFNYLLSSLLIRGGANLRLVPGGGEILRHLIKLILKNITE